MLLQHDDSTINIVLVLLLFIMYIRKSHAPLQSVSYSRRDQTTSRHLELHWLKVPESIQFQGVLAYRCLHNTAPAYLTERYNWSVICRAYL